MAYSMFGPGFVWLVRTDNNTERNPSRRFRLMCTYLAGSPLAGAHNRAQPLDMNTQNVAAAQAAGGVQGLSEEEIRRQQTQVQNNVGVVGAHAKRRDGALKTSFGGVHVTPVLCVNTWQHAWLPDHGVVGKMSFLEKWWDLVDWNVVDEISGTSMVEKDAFGHGGTAFHRS